MRAAVSGLGALLAAGCVGPDIDYGEVRTVDVAQVSQSGDYRLNAGDVFDVEFPYHPSRNLQLTVRPDGRVAMPFAEEVVALGKTIDELDQALTELVAKELRDPEIALIMRTYAQQKIFIGGEVKRPGQIDLIPGMTMYQAIAAAGWFKPESAEDSVILLRTTTDGWRQATKIDLSEEALLAGDAQLQPFDVLYVPQTSIARVGTWVDENINKVVPRFFYLSFVAFRGGQRGVF